MKLNISWIINKAIHSLSDMLLQFVFFLIQYCVVEDGNLLLAISCEAYILLVANGS